MPPLHSPAPCITRAHLATGSPVALCLQTCCTCPLRALSPWTSPPTSGNCRRAPSLNRRHCRPLPPSPTRCRRLSRALAAPDSTLKPAKSATRATGPFLKANASLLHVCNSPVVGPWLATGLPTILTGALDSSTVSQTMGLQVQTLLNPSEDSPSRTSIPDTPSSVRYPSGLSQLSQVCELSEVPHFRLTQAQSNALPSLNQGFDNRLSFEAGSQYGSRRSSVDSRTIAGMTHLAISPASPYDSQNTSRVSLVSNLQHQRGITSPDARSNGASPLSPMARSAPRANHPPRRAPVINPNPRSVSGMPDPMAPAPTKGYAWAFPADFEPDERRASSSGESSVERSTVPSRQNSFATSINSSIFTTDSKLPSGQQRLDDGMYSHSCYSRCSVLTSNRYSKHPSPFHATSQCHKSAEYGS